MFSNINNAWCTPQDFFDKLNKEFDFNLDPCATEKSAKCMKYFTATEDGLKQDWGGYRVFVNPPYGRQIGKWVKKCYEEGQKQNTLVVLLIPSRTDTRYFHDYILNKAEIRFIKGRLTFWDLDGEKYQQGRFKDMTPAPFPSCIAIFKPQEHQEIN
uniref:Putative methyltransferase n=2 Tax=viral metagenome TaxID=1070528 RepID=A0A6M3JXD9_9ZZZZ